MATPAVHPAPTYHDPHREWLVVHRDEYKGQWVVLDGNELVAHDADSGKVVPFARERQRQGKVPFLGYVGTDEQAAMRNRPPVVINGDAVKQLPVFRHAPSEWLDAHRDEYRGERTAQGGERLSIHGHDARKVSACLCEPGKTRTTADPYFSAYVETEAEKAIWS